MRGKQYNSLKKRYKERDHPRGCGENVAVTVQPHSQLGITPADAGKTYSNCVIGADK